MRRFAIAAGLVIGALARGADLPMPPPPALKASGPRPLRVAVLEPAFDAGVDARLKGAFAQSVTAEVRKLEKVLAIAADEIKQMVSFERSKQLMGCDESSSCMTELVNALAADELVSTRVSAVGQTYSVALQRLDARKGKVVQSFTRQLPRGNGEELLALVGPAVEALYPDRPLSAGRTRGVDRAVARKLNPPPLPRWLFFATAGTGAAAGATGGVFGLLADQSHGQWEALAAGSSTTPVSAAQLDALRRATDTAALRANVLYGAAAALAVGCLVEALFTDWNDDRAAIAVVPAAQGAGLSVQGRF
ncbi:MAG TPA: hypothetical protein VIG99_26670 [Myxococcaceae bacterium]